MTPTMRPSHHLRPVAALAMLLSGIPAGHALAQSQEFTLSGDAAEGEAWVQTQAPEPGSDEAVIASARRALAEGRPGRAESILDSWIEKNERSASPLLAEAYLLRGDAIRERNEYLALFDYETVIRDFSASPEFVTAVEREYEIGKEYLDGKRRKFLGVRIENAEPTGEELLIRVQERLPGSRLAERAALDLAEYYYGKRDLRMAGEMYAIFLANFPDSPYREQAALRQIFCNTARFKGPKYDASGLIEARLLIEDFRARHPLDAEEAGITEGLINRIDESAALQSLDTARWYLRTGDEPSARLVLRRLVRKHPESAAAQEAVRLMLDKGWTTPAEDPLQRTIEDAAAAAAEAGL